MIKEKIFRALEYPKAMDCLRDIDKFLEDWNKTSFIHKEHSIFNAFFGMPKVLLKKIFSQSSQKTE